MINIAMKSSGRLLHSTHYIFKKKLLTVSSRGRLDLLLHCIEVQARA
jgi:hypothetical protein